jgi:cyclohexanone monooxygenase
MTTGPIVAVIGAARGGVAVGIQLAQGEYDFTIYDRADGFGGTWRNDTELGAACDVPRHLFSHSFALNPRWSKTYANSPKYWRTGRQVATGDGLATHLTDRKERHATPIAAPE